MKIVSLADMKTHLSAYIDQCAAEGPIVITRNGSAVAVLVAPINDEDLEDIVVMRSPRFHKLLKKSRDSILAGNGLSEEEFWQSADKRME